jgi:hypothetical protein
MDRRHALFFDAASLDQVEQIRRRVRPINQSVREVVDKPKSRSWGITEIGRLNRETESRVEGW